MTEVAKIQHYENFPVASILLPQRMRAPVGVIYNFARGADDIADEGDATPAERHAGLAAYRQELDAIAAGRATRPDQPLFAALANVVHAHRLGLEPFYNLLSAFDQDVDTVRYADFVTLLDYCRRSANPVGRLMLSLHEAATPENLRCADAICTALQLINFWQDVEVDWRKGRIYVPQDDMRRFGVTEAQLSEQRCDANWLALMQFECNRARAMMLDGAPLANRLPGRFGLELCLVVQGGLRILERLAQVGYDVFRERPALGRADWAVVVGRGLAMRFGPGRRWRGQAASR